MAEARGGHAPFPYLFLYFSICPRQRPSLLANRIRAQGHGLPTPQATSKQRATGGGRKPATARNPKWRPEQIPEVSKCCDCQQKCKRLTQSCARHEIASRKRQNSNCATTRAQLPPDSRTGLVFSSLQCTCREIFGNPEVSSEVSFDYNLHELFRLKASYKLTCFGFDCPGC